MRAFDAFQQHYTKSNPRTRQEWQQVWFDVLDEQLKSTCACPENGIAPWPHYCLWCFKVQGCGKRDCPILLVCDHPKCRPTQRYDHDDTPIQRTTVCTGCMRKCGWRVGVDTSLGSLISVQCPQHKPFKTQPILNVSFLEEN